MARSDALSIVPLVVLLASCGSDPADVAGSYSISLTNRENGCMTDGWTEGATTTGVPLVVTQDGASFVAEVTGATAIALNVYPGDETFTGTISGGHLDGLLRGRAMSTGTCAYTVNIELDADLSGDVLTGELRWYADVNDSPDCAPYAGCSNRQVFNGTRPPTAD